MCIEDLERVTTSGSIHPLIQGRKPLDPKIIRRNPSSFLWRIFSRDCIEMKAFSFLQVLAWLPPHQKFDTLKALIMNSNYPSMVSLLLGIVRNEVASTIHEKNASKSEESPFVTGDVLELVEFVLKPMKGGPPDLPDQTDAVHSFA
eukprot:Gb_18674 [translate_table: standard]